MISPASRSPFAAFALALSCAGAISCGGADSAATPPVSSFPVWNPATLCQTATVGQPAPADESDLAYIVQEVQGAFFPQLKGAVVQIQAMQSSTDYFASFVDISTIDNAPLERTYLVRYNPKLFEDPAPFAAVAAIVAHELGHVVDYFNRDGDTLLQFAYWYGTADATDLAVYERATDEVSLKLGCGTGLKAYRLWLYAHVDEATVIAKQQEYYTPDEIDAWMAAHP